jgi:hypothetical protein
MWEAEMGPLGRVAIVAIAYLPVALFAGTVSAGMLRGAAPVDVVLQRVQSALPQVLLVVVAMGVLSQLLTVRPDSHPPIPEAERHHGRRGRRGGRRGRRGRRPGAHHP